MMMSVVMVLLAFVCHAQTPSQYHVVRVVGKVESPALKRELKTGDVIQSKDHLKFGTRESYIIVNSPQTGRKRISGVPDSSPREFLQLLQSFVQPELKNTSGRGIISLQYVEQLQASMAYDELLVLGNGFIPVNTQKLSLKKPAVIRAWHYDQQKKVRYVTISSDSGFSLYGPTLFGDHMGNFKTSKVVVEYFEDEVEDPMFNPGLLLGAFVPRYVYLEGTSENDLASEIRTLIISMDKSNKKDLIEEIKKYLRDVYAPAQDDNLNAFLKEHKIIE